MEQSKLIFNLVVNARLWPPCALRLGAGDTALRDLRHAAAVLVPPDARPLHAIGSRQRCGGRAPYGVDLRRLPS